MEDNVRQRGSYVCEVKDGAFASTPSYKPIFRGLAHEDTNSFGTHLYDSVSLPRSDQELVSTFKNSCRVFGFSLTEGAPVALKDAEPSAVTCQLNPGPSSFTRHVEDNFNPRHSLRAKQLKVTVPKVCCSVDLKIVKYANTEAGFVRRKRMSVVVVLVFFVVTT